MYSPSPRKSVESVDSPIVSPGARSPSTSRARYPFPRYDSSQRPAVNRMPNGRRGSNASLASSIGGTLDAAAHNTQQMNELSQNAISTLLSPAIVRTGLIPHTSLPASATHRAPSARDIPPVTLTSIPHVETSSFKNYLDSVGALYESYQRAKAANEEAASYIFGKKDEDPDYFPSSSRRGSQASLQSLRRPPSLLSPLSPGPPSPRGLSARRNNNAPTPLSTIPNVYFEDDFHLENPRTFDVVSEKSEVIPPPPPGRHDDANGDAKIPAPARRKALHTNAILQEKLSWYMDTVEVHLIQAISQASSSFFTALGSLKDLQSEADESIASIKSLRNVLQELDNGMAVGGLEIVKMRRRRENIRKLSQAISQLCDVVESAKYCEDLVDRGELGEATTRLAGLEKLIAGRDSGGFDLRQLNALKGLSEGIFELRLRIGRGYEGQFVEALLTDLRQHVQSVPPEVTLHRWAHASLRSRSGLVKPVDGTPAYTIPNESLRPDLMAALAGLSRAGHTARAATAYREAVMREIKSMIRRHLPSSSDDDVESITSTSTRGGRKLNQQEKSSILARNLRNLDPESAEELLIKVYTSVGEALRRLGVQVKVLLDVTLSIERPVSETPQSPTKAQTKQADISGEVMQALDLSSLLGQAVDVIQTQITKVLKVRADQSSRLPLQRFLRYFMLNRLFKDECEAVSSRPGDVLQQVVNAHVNDFLTIMSEYEKKHVTQVLDADKWEAVELTPRDSAALDRVLQGLDSTPKAWTQFTSLWGDTVVANNKDATESAISAATNGETSAAPSNASIDSQRYILVASTTTILHGIDTFLNLTAGIPSLAPDAAGRLLDYLKLANSRACQLILGAGATKSAGLKNITTKHLALASQLCSFVVALVPYAREFVRRQATNNTTTSNALQEFDRVKTLFQDHQSSIHDKLVEIMSARCNAHIKAFKIIDFDTPAAGAKTPSAYVEALAKESGTLHRVLSRHVAEIDLRMVMLPIFEHYKTEWGKALMETVSGVKTEEGKQRLLNDFQFLDGKLNKMDGSNGFTAELIGIVEAIVIAAPVASAAKDESNASVEAQLPSISAGEDIKPDEVEKQGQDSVTAATASAANSEPAILPEMIEKIAEAATDKDDEKQDTTKTSVEIMGGDVGGAAVSVVKDPSALFDADAEADEGGGE
ncbi:hypothetical protein FH972_024498 [Carpinus fangiana]|uniref:Vacuolar protein sorting-associated protein 54 C-terminal domain-containing protein n=1 Tax=Carpinus fangiana TaxID=176857 RepID=A0A5N6L0Q3_9ROSI|nr:hypothetical protein FH972_024498 [Carpinus fangiana]